MGVNSIVGDLTRETIDFIYAQTKRKKNKQKIEYIKSYITNILFADIQPYLYTIMGILIVGFVLNCFQFYYYIKLFMKNSKNILPLTFDTTHA
jgi:hypothetical protein